MCNQLSVILVCSIHLWPLLLYFFWYIHWLLISFLRKKSIFFEWPLLECKHKNMQISYPNSKDISLIIKFVKAKIFNIHTKSKVKGISKEIFLKKIKIVYRQTKFWAICMLCRQFITCTRLPIVWCTQLVKIHHFEYVLLSNYK